MSERAERIARELVVFNRGHLENQDWIDLNECVQEFLKHFVRLATHGHSISVDLAEDLWRVRCHPGQIRRVLMNLLLNAGEAMASGGEIIVRTENYRAGSLDGLRESPDAGRHVCLSIEDKGPGPASGARERIFEPFAGTSFSEGSGLGMAVVKGILSILEGWSEVESQNGNGKKIRIFLPAQPARRSPPPRH
ncbi:MAG: ATP-binding protein [bacterium]|nr:ATP-binding protein [bacterium]